MLPALASPALVALLLLGGGAAPSRQELAGRYGLRGTARVHAPPLADGDLDAAADAALAPGAGKDEVRIRLTWGKASCELAARADRGALVLAPGQSCDLALDEPELRGKVLARLRSGRAEVRGGTLALEGTWDLSGAVSVRVGGSALDILGAELPVGAWSPRTPVQGSAQVKLQGERLARPR